MNLQTFFEKFELFADSPNAVGKLRELVLNLAVQGKLDEQNSDDEPAGEFGTGFSRSNLEYMRKFFLLWKDRVLQISQTPSGKSHLAIKTLSPSADSAPVPIHQTLSGKLESMNTPLNPFTLSWFHYVLLLTGHCRTDQQRLILRLVSAPTGRNTIAQGNAETALNFEPCTGETYRQTARMYRPFQGFKIVVSITQGVVLGYRISPRWGCNHTTHDGFGAGKVRARQRIVAKVDELMALVDALETQLATARSAATALLAAAIAELTSSD